MTLKERRAKLVQESRELLDKVKAENRAMTEEEREGWDAAMKEVDELSEAIAREDRVAALEVELRRDADPTPPIRPNPAGPATQIGMSVSEQRRYSLMRAIRASASNSWREAEFELEVSNQVAKQLGREARGFFIPYDILTMKNGEFRDLLTTAEGELVPTVHLASSFIEVLYARALVVQMGATVLSGLVGNVDIPKQTAASGSGWVATEAAAVTEGSPTFGEVALSPKTLCRHVDISRRLMMQSSPSVEAVIRNDLAKGLAVGVDAAAINGAGSSGEPEGILNTTGIGDVAGGANGAAPDWADIVNLEREVAIDNADLGALGYLTNAKVRGKLKQTAKVSSTDSVMIWSDTAGNTPLNGYRAGVSNNVPSDLDKGTATGVCSAIIFGNFNDVIIAEWGTVDILADPYTSAGNSLVMLYAWQDADIGIRHAESFAAMQDALTT